MKKTGIVLSCMVSFFMSAQTHDLVKHNGEKMAVNLIKQETNLVYFSMPNSTEVEKISKYAVASLTNKSNGEVATISNRINCEDKANFNEVVFLEQSQTIGLKKGESINSFFGVTKGQADYDVKKMKKRRLQEKAASLKSPFVVILSEKPDETKAVLYQY
ncbi:hypothetical protein [Flavobacterium ammonificans]|uniref:hypothetical protein n=1 Tax=Flavobacterium ammonificans TaxID=1751056 RepID=UPI001E3C3D40|nr:hypothetical protein [Flavobacterium ammonificans]